MVAEVPEAVADALDLLDEQVDAFGRAVRVAGRVVGEDIWLPGSDGAGEAAAFAHVAVGAVRAEPLEVPPGDGAVGAA
jgi:hypothetical protein